MGKHAQPAPRSTRRRAAVVSAGTLVLCLSGAGPAFADLGPIPVPQPVGDAVTTVTHAAGLPDPLDSTSTDSQNTKPAHKVKHHTRHTTASLSIDLGTSAQTTAPAPHKPQHTQRAVAVAAPAPVGGLRALPAAPVTRVESVRPPVTAPLAAPAPAEAPAPATPAIVAAPAALLNGTGGEAAPRVLLLGLAIMVLGGLAAGHIRVAQDRLAAWSPS